MHTKHLFNICHVYVCNLCVHTCVKKVDIKLSIYKWRGKSTEYVYIGCVGYILIG